MTKRKTMTAVISARMIEALKVKPQALNDLVAISGLSKPVVARFIKSLQNDGGMCHVGGWQRDKRGYPTIQEFAWGNKNDVACPVSTETSAERMARLRKNRKEIERAPK